jgi:ketosteroid isomerase-like protein
MEKSEEQCRLHGHSSQGTNQDAREHFGRIRRENMTDDIVWTLPGTSLISGEASGVDAVIARAHRIVSYELTFNLKHIMIGQSGLALSLHNTASKGTQSLDEHLATVCTLRDGKICEINTYLSDVEMVNAFFV